MLQKEKNIHLQSLKGLMVHQCYAYYYLNLTFVYVLVWPDLRVFFFFEFVVDRKRQL